MDVAHYINHPEDMDRETLYDFRGLLALYPYYQTVRLLLLQNLYLLHDPSFNEELRDAALYITDRKVIFNLVESAHYQLPKPERRDNANRQTAGGQGDRTISLIDNFLQSIPDDESGGDKEKKDKKRKPTPADAAIDYVSYLLETESEEEKEENGQVPQMKGQSLIDDFINNESGKKIQLKDEPEYAPDMDEVTEEESDSNESYFTETLAKIYIKQGRYEKALEIIQRLNAKYPKQNTYVADQCRFLEKLILNNKNNK